MNDCVSFGNAAGQDSLLAYLVHVMGTTASLVNLGEKRTNFWNSYRHALLSKHCLNVIEMHCGGF